MSARASTSASPRACSGAMYAGVPMMAPVRVSRASSADATPKSTSFDSIGQSCSGLAADEDHVRRLDVAMHDADAVRVRERVGDVRGDLHGLAERERRALLALRDVLAVEPLHRDVGMPLVELPERDDAHDAGMTEPGEHAAFATEARLLAGVDAGDRDDLQRDGRLRDLVGRAIDDADAAAPDLALDHEAAREQPLKSRDHHVYERTGNEGACARPRRGPRPRRTSHVERSTTAGGMTALLAEPDEEELVALRARALRAKRALLVEDALHCLLGVGEVLAHEDLADERTAGLQELLGDGERAHEQLEAARLVADAIARRVRRHVAQHDVVGRVHLERLVLERERIALEERHVRRHRDGDRRQVDGEQPCRSARSSAPCRASSCPALRRDRGRASPA